MTSIFRGRLPFKEWWPLLVGVAVGLMLRLAFYRAPGGAFTAMSVGLLFASPLAVGAVTVYVAERHSRRSWGYYASAGAFANTFYVAGAVIVLIEGIVCAVIVLPLFMGIGCLAGLAMGAACRLMRKPSGPALCVALLPFAVGVLESPTELPTSIETIERSVAVAASPQELWRSIVDVPEVDSHEVPGTWLYRMGLPPPLAGVPRETADGPTRRVTMGQGVYFDEIVEEAREPEYLHWRFRFYDDSFPAGALDEHVAIGGHYFDFIDATYRMDAAGAGTRVTVTLRYRLTTPFNWYAAPFAEWLLGDLLESNLGYYRARAERNEDGRI
jgi:Polyketide cyclase / dehydrase and lipid transport